MSEAPRVLEEQNTGEHFVVVDTRHRKPVLFGLYPWQLAVISLWIATVIGWAVIGVVVHNTRENTRKVEKSICAQVLYLDGVKARDPRAQRRTDDLVRTLRELQPGCGPGPRPVPAPPG